MTRLAPVDAQTFWMSATLPNDQFLLYAFAGDPGDFDEVLVGLRGRAAACAELRLRIADDCAARYPRWVRGDLDAARFTVGEPGLDWTGCLDAVARLADDQLDPSIATWRLHVFPAVRGAPRAECATVAVLQIVHALADGTRTADLAAWLFGRDQPVQPIAPEGRGSLVLRSVVAASTHRQLTADIAAGTIPAPAGTRPALLTNATPPGTRRIRTLVRQRAAFGPGATVTATALTAIGGALADFVRARGDDPARLGAEVPMAESGIRHACNHFHNVAIDLHPGAAPAERVARIADQLRDARIRAGHPAMIAERRALAAVPAALLRWGVSRFDPTALPPVVTGNTVVSSVNRGPADLRFGMAPVVLTAGYPALSPMMGLTHGVHGIGDTVAVSVHTTFETDDLDDYLARLDAALG